ncbi:hypothetical protein Q671_17680 [Halomonas sp. PBN3]|nr:hypothetical protein Q671_17680 [Halomonas sp. PBN3]
MPPKKRSTLLRRHHRTDAAIAEVQFMGFEGFGWVIRLKDRGRLAETVL